MLSKKELFRYSRQIILPELGLKGQQRLMESSVLVIGAGGLSSPALLYLTAAGVGRIGIVDFDVVDESNLQRQILFGQVDVGVSKAARARDRLQEQNPLVIHETHHCKLTSANAMDIIAPYSLVIDGSDNLPTRYLVNDACYLLKKTLVYGAIFRFEGQVSVFNQPDQHGNRGPNYRDLFPEPPPPEMVPSCAEGGVMGALAGIIGSMQASEAIKILTGMGTSLSGRLLIFDSLDFTTHFIRLKPNPENPLSGSNSTIKMLIDYEAFCNPRRMEHDLEVNEISPEEVKKMKLDGQTFQLIDVREPVEYQLVNIGAINIPLASLKDKLTLISQEGLVVVHCKSGQRSLLAIRKLQAEYGFKNLKNMTGGLLGWKKNVEPDLDIR